MINPRQDCGSASRRNSKGRKSPPQVQGCKRLQPVRGSGRNDVTGTERCFTIDRSTATLVTRRTIGSDPFPVLETCKTRGCINANPRSPADRFEWRRKGETRRATRRREVGRSKRAVRGTLRLVKSDVSTEKMYPVARLAPVPLPFHLSPASPSFHGTIAAFQLVLSLSRHSASLRREARGERGIRLPRKRFIYRDATNRANSPSADEIGERMSRRSIDRRSAIGDRRSVDYA